jgi:hypothetical protein
VKLADIGNSYLSGGVLVPFEDSEGNRIVGNLNGSGGKITDGNPPSTLTKDIFEAISFSFLRV